MIRLGGVSVLMVCGVVAWHANSEPGPKPREVPDPLVWPQPHGYVCSYAPDAIKIDGKLDDAAWQKLPWSEDFQDIEGDRQPKPRHRTRMKMAWDKHGLYIAAELEEPHVWGTLKDHDSVIFIDNDFEVFLDPDGDGHNYGELELNALNTTWDLFLTRAYKDGGSALHAWEIMGLKTAVHVNGTLNDPSDTDKGWTVEIFWPWDGLKELSPPKFSFPPRDGDQWRINFSRVEWDHTIEKGKYVKVPKRPEYNWVWSPQGVIDMHRPERWGVLQFSTAPVGTVKFTPDPAQAARDYLHRVYYAQNVRVGNKQPRATQLEQLKLALPKGLSNPVLETTKHAYEARVDLETPKGKVTYRIDQQARFTRE